MLIEDGKGTGVKAQVNVRNHLVTTSVALSDEAFVSLEDSRAYSLDTKVLAIPAAFDGVVMYLQNLDPEKDIVIARLNQLIDLPSAGASWSLLRNPTLATLANNNAKLPINLNFESGQKANVVAEIWDEVGGSGITGITSLPDGELGPVSMAGSTVNPTESPIVLGQSDVLAIRVTAGAAGFDLTSVIRFYFDTSGAK